MTAATRVNAFRPVPQTTALKVGAPVRAAEWLELARLVHWLRGRGRVLVPGGRCGEVLDAVTTSTTLRYRTAPSGLAIARVWVVDVRCTGAFPSFASFTLQAGSGPTSATYVVNTRSLESVPVVYIETPATKTTATTSLGLVVTRVDGTMEIQSVACWELPRAQLTKDGTDLAIDLDSIYPRRPIFDATYENTKAIARAMAATDGRRVGHVAMSFPYIASTSGAGEAVFEDAIPCVPRQDARGETTRTLKWDVYAWVSAAATTGDIWVTSSGGASAPLAVSSTTPAWLGPGVTATLRNEDLTTTNGVRTGTYDGVQLNVKRRAGAGEVRISAFSAWEGS